MPNFYVRRKNSPLQILSNGHSERGKYQFDSTLYEEVEGDLPNNVQYEAIPPSGMEILNRIRTNFRSLTLEQQYQLRGTMAEVVAAAQMNNVPLMREVLARVILLPTLEPLRGQMLAQFN
jgi:hypothetical protein